MALVYLATLGTRPEAITVALDRLSEEYRYTTIGLLHTDPKRSAIAPAYTALVNVLARDYAALRLDRHLMTDANGQPLVDIVDPDSAEAYLHAVLAVIRRYHQDGERVHLLVAGGRKAMSIYAMLAATLLFVPPHDKVWTVLSPDHLMQTAGQFHIPPGEREAVQVVELPIISARLAPGADPLELLARRNDQRADFLTRLPKEERALAELFSRHPTASNAELAKMLHKTEKTIENQFTRIYDRLVSYLNLGDTLPIRARRIALAELLRHNR